MFKKTLPILSTLIIGLSSLSPLSASATVLTPGKTVYTADELIDFSKSYYQELDEKCGTDAECIRSTYMEKLSEGGIYNALDTFLFRNILVTSVNPGTGTVKIFLQSRDVWGVRYPITEGPAVVNHLYMGWDDPGTDFSLFQVGQIYPISEADRMPDHFHYIYPTTPDAEGYNWPATGVEYTIELGDNSLVANTDAHFSFDLSTQFLTDRGLIEYTSCLASPYYREGMECRMVFHTDSGYQYVPYLNGIPAYPPYTSDGSTDNTDNTDNTGDSTSGTDTSDNTSGANSETNNSGSGTSENNTTSSTTPVNSTATNTTNSTTTSTTNNSNFYNSYLTKTLAQTPAPLSKVISGKASKNADSSATVSKSSQDEASKNSDSTDTTDVPFGGESNTNHAAEFPWWLIISILAIDVIVMWLLYPKKSKKGLDKKTSI